MSDMPIDPTSATDGDGTVREPFFEPPRGREDDDPEHLMGDGGVREPFFEPPRGGEDDISI